MKSLTQKVIFWAFFAVNTSIILGCIAKFCVWDINYYLASDEIKELWRMDFDLNDYPRPVDTVTSAIVLTAATLVEWQLINLLKKRSD